MNLTTWMDAHKSGNQHTQEKHEINPEETIMQEVKRSGYDGLLPAGLVLTGGTSQLRGLRELGRRVMNMPVRIGEPQGLVGLVDTISTPAYATGAGLLRWGDRQGEALLSQKRHGPGVGQRLSGFLRSLLPDRGGI